MTQSAEVERAAVRRILLIDDTVEIHEDFRKVFAPPAARESLSAAKQALFGTAPVETVTRPRFATMSAGQGEEGVTMARTAREAGEPYQVAFVDMRMPPGWDGLTTIEQLWRVDPRVQVVICTAFSDHALEHLGDRFRDSDQLLVLKKPFESAEILQLAATLSEKWLVERQMERRVAALEHDIRHDRLTGLPNRLLLSQRLEACLERQKRRPDGHFALLYLDCDGFKAINDTLGHEIGDQLLVAIAGRLRESLRAYDLIAQSSLPSRIGGDEFLVLLEELRDGCDSALVAQRLLAALVPPFQIGGTTLAMSMSIGIAASGGAHPLSAAEMIREADAAMYRAKAEGGARFTLFDPTMHREASDRLELTGALRRAVAEDGITLVYQPIFRLTDRSLVGFEALARWHHPDRGIVPPDRFVPLAEEIGLIGPLGAGVLLQACRQLADWRKRFPVTAAALRVSVNLSPRQLGLTNLAATVVNALDTSTLLPESLVLEVTEGMPLLPGSSAVQVLERLRGAGVALHMDDFGVGYSSLIHLCHLPIAALKIDRAFVAGEEPSYRMVLETMVALGHGLGLTLIGEGIETPEQLARLQALGVELGQGYLLGRPASAADAEALLR